MSALSAELRRDLHYCDITGTFTWIRIGSRVKPGKIAGTLLADGYCAIRWRGKRYGAHRLAWLYVYGEWPREQIDHIDGVRANNRGGNLREATQSQNQGNTRIRKDNTSGIKGVCWSKAARKWLACIQVNGKFKHLGLFITAEEASAAYRKAANAAFGEFAMSR
jgi:hypothetical protein